MSVLLRLAGVHTHIGRYHILHGVDMQVLEGKTTMLLGRNGAGKTTTLRTTMGLWHASAGEIRFVAPALQFWAPASKEYPGDLVVRQNPMLVGGGRYDVYNLITSTGEQVGVVGFDESRLQYFLKEFGTPRN